ncbi:MULTISPECIES: hypothetical protein [Moorena]|uniref:Uncharacterized protein n=2 Tax=Moorena producens TaxID=1155739 RepID=A0A9Q9SUQ1_MOOP1|nr:MULTISPECIES: hypothetical protein [Moorena]WAN69997.1 hypothetical protein BJP36_38670 [Moorena producens JHB]
MRSHPLFCLRFPAVFLMLKALVLIQEIDKPEEMVGGFEYL